MILDIFKRKANKKEERDAKLTDPEAIDIFSATPTWSAVRVSELQSLQAQAVWSCVKVISESLASLPLQLFEKIPEGRKKATDHALYSILHDLSNDEMTSMTFRETMQMHLCLWGNAYAYIDWNGAGQVRGLWPLLPDQTFPMRDKTTKKLYYVTTDAGTGNQVKIPAYKIFHITGLSMNGIVGLSPIATARNTIGNDMATSEFVGRFFGNDATPGGLLEHPGKLSDAAYGRLKTDWNKMHMGLSNSHRIAILEEGMKYTTVTMPLKDAQFLELKKFSRSEIAAIFRVPPHKIGDLEKSTFSNIEHQGIEFVTDTLSPWIVRWEQGIFKDLLTRQERKKYFAKHNVNALLRGDTKARYDAYAVGRQWGWLSADDVRELEDMNPIPEGQGSVYFVPLNMLPADRVDDYYNSLSAQSASDPGETERETETETKSMRTRYDIRKDKHPKSVIRSATLRRELTERYKSDFEDAVGRIIKIQSRALIKMTKEYFGTRAINKDAYIDEVKRYANDYDYAKRFWPVLLGYAKRTIELVADEIDASSEIDDSMMTFLKEYQSSFNNRYIAETVARIRKAVEKAQNEERDEISAVETELKQWEENRAQSTANAESVRSGNAVAITMYANYGWRARWVNTGSENCPYCRALDGKVVDAGNAFLQRDADFEPEGALEPLRPSRTIRHAPAHRGCDCMIVAD